MTVPIPDLSIFNGKMSMEQLITVRKMQRADAELYLTQFDLSEEDYAKALELAGRDVKPTGYDSGASPVHAYSKDRRLWISAAWLLGASYRKLAALHGVSHQTVADSMRRLLPPGTTRVAVDMKLEHLSAYYNTYKKEIEHLRGMEPAAVAEFLQSHTDLD